MCLIHHFIIISTFILLVYLIYYSIFKKSPLELKRIVYNLETIDCIDGNGDLKECVKIPEVLFTYISGRY